MDTLHIPAHSLPRLSRVALGLVLGLACAAWMLRGEKDIEARSEDHLEAPPQLLAWLPWFVSPTAERSGHKVKAVMGS